MMRKKKEKRQTDDGSHLGETDVAPPTRMTGQKLKNMSGRVLGEEVDEAEATTSLSHESDEGRGEEGRESR